MLTRVEAQNYRCLADISLDLENFQILIGPNGSGKSTFLDALLFLSDLLSDGLEIAVRVRTRNFHDLVRGRRANRFRLVVEAQFPDGDEKVRYDVAVGVDVNNEQLVIENENLVVSPGDGAPDRAVKILDRTSNQSLFTKHDRSEQSRLEVSAGFSALSTGNLTKTSPAAEWFKQLIRDQVRLVSLDSNDLYAPAPPALKKTSRMTGSYLASAVFRLATESERAFSLWLDHVRTVLPDIEDVSTTPREEDRHRYVVIRYRGGVDIPSWIVSEGTLRLLALTILPYLPDAPRVLLIEEPENAIHPAALEAVYQSLSSVYGGQVLIATHSPLLLGLAEPRHLLCFSKGPAGPVVIRGDHHPVLSDWQHDVDLGTLVASGVLG